MSTDQVIGQPARPTLFGLMKNLSSSVVVWLALMGYLVLVKVVITFFPAASGAAEARHRPLVTPSGPFEVHPLPTIQYCWHNI